MAISTATLLLAASFTGGQFGFTSSQYNANVVLQEADGEFSGKEIPAATNEVGAEIGTGVMGGNIIHINGTFLWKGKSITGASGFGSAADIGSTLVFALFNADAVLLETFGYKLNHEAWVTGNFKALSLSGVAASTPTN